MPAHDAARAPHMRAAHRGIRLWHLTPLPVVRHRCDLHAEVRSYVGGCPPLRSRVRASFHGLILAPTAVRQPRLTTGTSWETHGRHMLPSMGPGEAPALPGRRAAAGKPLVRSPRHWPWVALSLVAVLCAGVVAVPVSWAVLRQAEAERGEATPDAAVNLYVLRMSSGERIGLSRVLAGRRHDELLRQWREYRGEMERGNVPSKLEVVGPIDVEDQADDRATVTAHVHAVWWTDQVNLSGTAHPWRFETRRDASGWRVWSAELPPWCGVHLRADACR